MSTVSVVTRLNRRTWSRACSCRVVSQSPCTTISEMVVAAMEQVVSTASLSSPRLAAIRQTSAATSATATTASAATSAR